MKNLHGNCVLTRCVFDKTEDDGREEEDLHTVPVVHTYG